MQTAMIHEKEVARKLNRAPAQAHPDTPAGDFQVAPPASASVTTQLKAAGYAQALQLDDDPGTSIAGSSKSEGGELKYKVVAGLDWKTGKVSFTLDGQLIAYEYENVQEVELEGCSAESLKEILSAAEKLSAEAAAKGEKDPMAQKAASALKTIMLKAQIALTAAESAPSAQSEPGQVSSARARRNQV